MGMAASQARLLSITARIHDVEYQAQSIQNAKLQLATQEDRIYTEYNEALNATTLTATFIDSAGEKMTVPATFKNLFSKDRNRIANGTEYALFNDKGQLVVEDAIYDAYTDMKNKGVNDPYLFAMYMAFGSENARDGWLKAAAVQNGEVANCEPKLLESEEAIYNQICDETKNSDLKEMHEALEKYTGSEDIYNSETVPDDKKADYNAMLTRYRSELYKRYDQEIGKQVAQEGSTTNEAFEVSYNYNESDFNYYLDMFKQIESNPNGCISISSYNGSFGSAENSGEWLQAMIESGQFTIEKVERNDGQVKFDSVAVASESCLAYTETATIDNTARAKAEAKYEHDMRQIDKKDKQYDLDLSKLETERQALTTEYDSVKKVIEDNIDRTFGIFS